ncbi:MAG: glycerophosphodiester phosphodiesterase [Lachnospiraceae bacterium]|nr:glycerophosphodiester phosphodiesterase [Lachnospiraceae bacterium]
MNLYITLFIVVIVGIILFALYLLAIKPNDDEERRKALKPLEDRGVAHRGIFNNKGDAPENSLLAYQRAVEYNVAFECDVHLTKDGKLAMLHDPNLKRMCGVDIPMNELTYEEICQYRLKDSDQVIPLLDDVLEMVHGQVPIVLEIKPHGNYKETIVKVAERMDAYEGFWVLESFHPSILRWFYKNRPEIIRGQLSTDMFRNHLGKNLFEKIIITTLVTNFLVKPDFISYNYKHRRNIFYRLMRKLYRCGNAGWTFRSKKAVRKYGKRFDTIIFDGFIPKHLEKEHK